MFWKRKKTEKEKLPEKVIKEKPEGYIKKVLIVDDEDYDLEKISGLVKNLGYEPIIIQNADSAIYQIKKGLEYDLLITDNSMHATGVKENGGKLLARISKKINPENKVIIYSCWPGSTQFLDEVDCAFAKSDECDLKYNMPKTIERYLSSTDK